MQRENLDFDSIMKERRKAVEQSIRQITHQELTAIVERLFAKSPVHHWKQALDQFLAENPHGTFYHATAQDQLEVVYSAEKEKGIWFFPGAGMGIIQDRGIKALNEIIARL